MYHISICSLSQNMTTIIHPVSCRIQNAKYIRCNILLYIVSNLVVTEFRKLYTNCIVVGPVIQGTEKVSQYYALKVKLRVWVSVHTVYKHWGLCLCLGETDQLDRFIDKSGFNDTFYVVYPWNVRKFKASWCYTRIVWFMLTWYVSAPFVSDLAMLPSE